VILTKTVLGFSAGTRVYETPTGYVMYYTEKGERREAIFGEELKPFLTARRPRSLVVPARNRKERRATDILVLAKREEYEQLTYENS
jgi:hypothetical protein